MRYIVPCCLLLAGSIPGFATVDNGLLALVPSGAKVVSGVDVNRARNSLFGQFMLGKINSDHPEFDQMVQQTGFDPRRDIEDVLFASSGPAGQSTPPPFSVLVRGNFDQARIKKTLVSKGATVQPFQGVDILLETSPHGKHAFAFPDVDIAVMGDLASVQQIISNRANPTPLDSTLQQLVMAAGTNQDAWFAALGASSFFPGNFTPHANSHMSAETLQSILESSGGVLFGTVVQLSFDAVTRSPQDAVALTDVVRFGTSMMQMQRQKDPKADVVATSLDNMTLQANGSNVHIGLSIPESGLEQLAQLDGQASSSGGIRPSRR